MRQNFRAIAVLGIAAAIALSAAGAFAAPPPPPPTPAPFAPLWVFPRQPQQAPAMQHAPAQPTTTTLIVRDQPSLLTPADAHFSVETQSGVVVVRGPRAH